MIHPVRKAAANASRNHRRALLVAFLVIVLILGAVFVWLYRRCGDMVFLAPGTVIREAIAAPRWKTVVATDVLGAGVVEYRERYWESLFAFESAFRWRRPDGQVLDYGVWSHGARLTRQVEVRATTDHRSVWVVARDKNAVIASLDTITGRFIGENWLAMDPSLPVHAQERAAQQHGQPGHPSWATPNGGILLAESR